MRSTTEEFKQYVLALAAKRVMAYALVFKDSTGALADWGGKLTSYAADVRVDAVGDDWGVGFKSIAMRIQPPRDALTRGRGRGRITLQNIDLSIVGWLRKQTDAPTLILAAGLVNVDGDGNAYITTLDIAPQTYTVGEISQTVRELTLPITIDPLFAKAVNEIQFDPARTPALYV